MTVSVAQVPTTSSATTGVPSSGDVRGRLDALVAGEVGVKTGRAREDVADSSVAADSSSTARERARKVSEKSAIVLEGKGGSLRDLSAVLSLAGRGAASTRLQSLGGVEALV